jgi:hypothetical protein
MSDSQKKTWKELKAEGITRCHAMFTNGKQCRRRAIDGKSWCKNHIGIFKALREVNEAALEGEK